MSAQAAFYNLFTYESKFRESVARYVKSMSIDVEEDAHSFRFTGDPMVLVSEDSKTGHLVAIASLHFRPQEENQQITTIYKLAENKFHGLINKANQAFQFDLTHLFNGTGQLNFNVLQPDGRKINDVNVVRPFETVSVKGNVQHKNGRLILNKEDLVQDKKDTSKMVELTVKQNQEEPESKKGAVYFLSVTPEENDSKLCHLFNQKVYWVSVDKIPIFVLYSKQEHQQNFNFGGSRGATRGIVQSSSNSNSGFNWGSALGESDSFGFSANSNSDAFSATPIYRDTLESLTNKSATLSANRTRNVFNESLTLTKGVTKGGGRRKKKGQQVEEDDCEEETWCVDDNRRRSRSRSPVVKKNLVLESTVGKVAHGDEVSTNGTKSQAEFNYNLTVSGCRLELSIQAKLNFMKVDTAWESLAMAYLLSLKQGNIKKAIEKAFKAEECCICLEEGPNVLFFPCHHQCIHSKRACDPASNSGKAHQICPFCRAIISSKIIVV